MDKFVILETGERHAAACFGDGVQFSTGCTFGKGLMRKIPKGKFAFVLVDKASKKAVRVRIKNEVIRAAFNSPFITEFRKKGVKPTDIPEDVAFGLLKRAFTRPVEQLLEISGPFDYELDELPSTFTIVECEKCGEVVAENHARLHNSKIVCVDCFIYEK